MAHEIIMPALGMTQDTGIIVSWHKQLGDPIKASDVLMEVETDKTTVEVEAGHDGFLTAVRAETGVPVPVGDVVAVISDDKNAVEAPVAVKPATTVEPAKDDPVEPQASTDAPAKPQQSESSPAPAPVQRPILPQTGGRILASPKARRIAKERGIDLGRLTRLGVPQPIHVADLDKAGAGTASTLQSSLMRVRIDRAPFEAFLTWVAEDAGVQVDGLNVWAAFAAGSLRTAFGHDQNEDIVVEARRFPDTLAAISLRSPDRTGLSELETEVASGEPALTVLDLTETLLTEYRAAGERRLPHLAICNGEDAVNFDLHLEFDPTSLPAETAYAFLKELADRAQVPLRHLL